jgi:hypothetical protein
MGVSLTRIGVVVARREVVDEAVDEALVARPVAMTVENPASRAAAAMRGWGTKTGTGRSSAAAGQPPDRRRLRCW